MPLSDVTRPQDPPAVRPPLACPVCDDCVQRVPRRWIDRFVGLFVSQRRYRCQRFGCGWEGNLRRRSASGSSSAPDRRDRLPPLVTPQMRPFDAQGRLPR